MDVGDRRSETGPADTLQSQAGILTSDLQPLISKRTRPYGLRPQP